MIRVELARLRYTQGSLAEALKLVDYALVRRLRGEVDWKLGELRVVAEFLEISVAQLVPGLDQRAA